MKIYYSSSLWDKRKGFCGVPQRVNWQFKYEGNTHHIPVIYRFSKGIVFDVITILDEEKLRSFFEKYEAIEETLTPLERRCAEQEHPYQPLSLKEICIDDKVIKNGYSSSSTVSMPWAKDDYKQTLNLRKAYADILKDTKCFSCHRFCLPYPNADSKIQKMLRLFRLNKIKKLKFSTEAITKFFPLDIHFNMSDQESPKEITFVHPKTGIEHKLYFQNPESVEIPLSEEKNHSFYAMQTMYEIEPALSQGDYLAFDTSTQYIEPPEGRFSPTAAGAIGIIGGSCGPTAIFAASDNKEEKIPCGLHGLPLHSCFSVPNFNKEDNMDFVIEGIHIRSCEGKAYSFQ